MIPHTDSILVTNIKVAAFEKGSKDLKSIMYWRNMKLNIFIGVLVICVIVILILLFTNN